MRVCENNHILIDRKWIIFSVDEEACFIRCTDRNRVIHQVSMFPVISVVIKTDYRFHWQLIDKLLRQVYSTSSLDWSRWIYASLLRSFSSSPRSSPVHKRRKVVAELSLSGVRGANVHRLSLSHVDTCNGTGFFLSYRVSVIWTHLEWNKMFISWLQVRLEIILARGEEKKVGSSSFLELIRKSRCLAWWCLVHSWWFSYPIRLSARFISSLVPQLGEHSDRQSVVQWYWERLI